MRHDDPLALTVTAAVRDGDLPTLRRLLADNAGLATARIVDEHGSARTLLHVLTDWPAKCPRGAQTVTVLVAVGADVNARFQGSHSETPLHWAASADDVEVLDALLVGATPDDVTSHPGARATAVSGSAPSVCWR